MKTKLIAIYFPQFHETPENNEWWGTGFSDWKLVKEAQPLFQSHYQPRVPLHHNYYDPSESSVLSEQAELAKKYGIDGFMFYHYWFDGKLMLEKPMETLSAHPEITIPFCICWANGSWTRQWLGNNEILLEQKHLHDTRLWKKHFEYLLRFFKDERYIKVDGKPLISVYCPDLVKHTEEMFCYWESLAKENGLQGIHFMAVKNYDFPNPHFLKNYDSMMKFQPREANTAKKNPNRQKMSSLKLFRFLPEKLRFLIGDLKRKLSKYNIIRSDAIWDYIISNAGVSEYSEYPDLLIFESAFWGWDNTARYRSRATIFTELSKEEKYMYFRKLWKKVSEARSEFLFFNAWNEWSESAYLEPDEKYGYENLEIISGVVKEYPGDIQNP